MTALLKPEEKREQIEAVWRLEDTGEVPFGESLCVPNIKPNYTPTCNIHLFSRNAFSTNIDNFSKSSLIISLSYSSF